MKYSSRSWAWVAVAWLTHSLFWTVVLALLSLVLTSATSHGAQPAGAKHSLPEQFDMDAWVAQFEGAWAGGEKVNRTPFGPFGFLFLFERQDDGSLHAHTALSKQTWVDLRFHKSAKGDWLLTEAAALAGIGEQSHTMKPVSLRGNQIDWVTEDPDYMTCTLDANPEKMSLLVTLHGKEHVYFELDRVDSPEAIAEIRHEQQEAKQRDGQNDMQQLMSRGTSAEDDEPSDISAARAAAVAHPADPEKQMQLAQALQKHINSAPPMKVAAYASEMYKAMQAAVELDPDYAEAHFGLAQYYLNAPAFAGGSVEKAKQEAEILEKLDADLAQRLREQIASRQD